MKRITAGTLIALILTITPALAKTAHAAAATTADDNGNSALIGFLFLAVCAAVCGAIAKRNGRNPVGWAFAGFFFNIFAIITVALLGARGGQRPKKLSPDEQQEIDAKIAAIRSGHLTPFVPAGVMPGQGEHFYWEQRAQYGQTFKQQVHRGSNPALYVPLGHGLRMRVGGYQGTSQNVSNFAWGPMGTVYISNMRVLFKADNGEVAQAPFRDVITYDAFPDGLGLNVAKIGTMQFKTGDECLGAVFLKMVQGPPKEELTTT